MMNLNALTSNVKLQVPDSYAELLNDMPFLMPRHSLSDLQQTETKLLLL